MDIGKDPEGLILFCAQDKLRELFAPLSEYSFSTQNVSDMGQAETISYVSIFPKYSNRERVASEKSTCLKQFSESPLSSIEHVDPATRGMGTELLSWSVLRPQRSQPSETGWSRANSHLVAAPTLGHVPHNPQLGDQEQPVMYPAPGLPLNEASQ